MDLHDAYDDAIIRATDWFDAFDRIYGIRRRRISFIRCNSHILTPKGDYKGQRWVTQPGRKLMSRQRIISNIINDLALEDLHFAWGVSYAYCNASRSIQMEWDFNEATEPVNEDYWEKVINRDCLNYLISKGIHPHFIFTGGRSVHAACYFNRMIPVEVLKPFVACFHTALIETTEPCSDSLSNGMRLPLSIHQKTGGLCRFAQTFTPEQIVKYAKQVQPDDMTPGRLKRIMQDWLSDHPQHLIQSSKLTNNITSVQMDNVEDGPDEASADDLSLTTTTTPPPTHIDIVSAKPDYGDSDAPVISTKYCLEHPRRDEYEQYLEEGIPSGESWAIIRNSNFIFWALHKFNSKDRLWDALAPKLGIGVREGVHMERLHLLIWKLDNTAFKPTIPGQKRGTALIDEAEAAWLTDLSVAVHRDFRKQKAVKLTSLAYYLLQKLRDFGEANIGVQEVAEFLADDQNTRPTRMASEYLSVFKEGKYKILELVERYKAPMGGPGRTSKYRRVERLPDLSTSDQPP